MQTTLFLNDVALDIEYTATPGRRGCQYLRNGDPGYPDEPGEVEIESICIDGNEVTELLAQWVIDRCQAACEEDAPSALQDAHDDYLQGRAEQRYLERAAA